MKAFAPLTDRDSPTGIPTDSAQEIVVSLKSRGQLSLRALIKFSDAPLVELDASNCGVTDDWLPLIAAHSLESLDLSGIVPAPVAHSPRVRGNPGITDDGVAMLVGVGAVQELKESGGYAPAGSAAAGQDEQHHHAPGAWRLPQGKGERPMDDDAPASPQPSPLSPGTPPFGSVSSSPSLATSPWGSVLTVARPTRTVQRLSLAGTSISNAGAAALAALPSLTALDVSRTQLGNAGVAALADCSSLTSLTLAGIAKLSNSVSALAAL
ncbi:hypothetical protein T484DRAFT_1775981, partial [Baffinella frigidus]